MYIYVGRLLFLTFKTLICEVLRGSAFSSKPFLTPMVIPGLSAYIAR